MKKLKLQPSWHSKAKDGCCYVYSPVLGKVFEVKHIDPYKLDAAFDLLRQGVEAIEALAILQTVTGLSEENASRLLSFLQERGIVLYEKQSIHTSQASSGCNFEFFTRQEDFFSHFETSQTSSQEMNERLQNRTVLIVGLGGYGTWITLLMARMGIRKIIGVDFDTVEASNLNRQVLYNTTHIGQLKTDSCLEEISRLGTGTQFTGINAKVENQHDFEGYLDNVDLVFNSSCYREFSDPTNTLAGQIALACIKKKVPCLNFSGSLIGPLYIPDLTCCYLCALNTIAKKPKNSFFIPPIAPLISSAMSMVALEAALFLSDVPLVRTKNTIVMWDSLRLEQGKIPLQEQEFCQCH